LVDADGRALVIEPHPASIQDRDGGGPLLRAFPALYPCTERVFADSAYNHERVQTATSIVVETVRKIADQVGFVVLPHRCVVERFVAWMLGSIEISGWLRTSRRRSTRPEPSSTRPTLCYACDASLAEPNYETDS
jgi:hypothetical protein